MSKLSLAQLKDGASLALLAAAGGHPGRGGEQSQLPQ
jgi:hypothetical protein